MSKNITIAEGSQAKNFNTVHKLRTNLIGGGTQYWIPEDEAGAYANMGQKTITANGTYTASDDDKDGYSQVTVNVPPTRPNLITKSITANGLYRAIDDEADGYSQVNVNVAGVGEAVGTDTTDGNEYIVKTDPQTGTLEKTVLPSAITITRMPNKMDYIRGENIDISGMIVKAFKKDNTIWEGTGYSGGVIPNNELGISPRVVQGNFAYQRVGLLDYSIYCCPYENKLLLGTESMPVRPNYAAVYEQYGYNNSGRLACFRRGNSSIFVGGSTAPFHVKSYEYWRSDGDYWGRIQHNVVESDVTHTYTRDGKTAYVYFAAVSGRYNYILNSEFNDVSASEEFDYELIGWVMTYGNVQNVYGQTESVDWHRPQDNKVLHTEFTVHAIED